jgi:hypothetical protein
MDDLPTLSTLRRVVFGLLIFVGSVEFLGAMLWVIFALPYALDHRIWVLLVVLFLFTGPMAMLPGTLLAIFRPRLAGTLLIAASFVGAVVAEIVMWDPGAEWSGPPGERMPFAIRWSLTSILPFSLPLLAVGASLVWTTRPSIKAKP